MARKPAPQSQRIPSSSTPRSTTTSMPTPPPSSQKPQVVSTNPSSTTISAPPPSSKPTAQLSSNSSPRDIALHVWNRYLNDTPPRTLLLDVFMAFLVLVGVIQFVYCVIAGNYPFNAFLSGFSAAVGQFVLTASLRMQTSERPPTTASSAAKKSTSKTIDGLTGDVLEEGGNKISSERAFADFVFGSLILHGFCVNFIN